MVCRYRPDRVYHPGYLIFRESLNLRVRHPQRCCRGCQGIRGEVHEHWCVLDLEIDLGAQAGMIAA